MHKHLKEPIVTCHEGVFIVLFQSYPIRIHITKLMGTTLHFFIASMPKIYSIFSAIWQAGRGGEYGCIMFKHRNFDKSLAHGNRSVKSLLFALLSLPGVTGYALCMFYSIFVLESHG